MRPRLATKQAAQAQVVAPPTGCWVQAEAEVRARLQALRGRP